MRRSSAVAGVVALFLVGVAVGALGASLVVNRHGTRGGFGGFNHHMMTAELYRRLDLDAAQRQQVDAIFADSHRETAALWREVRPRVEAVIARTQSRISLVLKPGQRQEFDRYCREHSEPLRQMFGHGHH